MEIKNKPNTEILASLALQVVEISSQIENLQVTASFRKSISLILQEFEQELGKPSINKEKLKQCAFGLFRLVTESSKLERSPIGVSLLTFLREVSRLID